MAPDSNPDEAWQRREEWTPDQWEAICKSGVYGMTPEAKWPALELWESAVRASERASRVFTQEDVEKAAVAMHAANMEWADAFALGEKRGNPNVYAARAALAALGEVEVG